ncbi:MAG TPA: ABC transporter permease [Propionibacteriaceae bacterium]|nr:ABC transporter permease [Propionibacteriaceae bacterium]
MHVVRQILTRLSALVLSLLVASLLIFVALNALPGDATSAILGTNADPVAVAQLRARLGLDRPLLVRYVSWLAGLLRGDLGTSLVSGDAVSSLILPRLGVTVSLVAIATVLSVAIALPLGMYAAVHRRRARGFVAATVSQLGMAVPAFVAGIVLVLVFAVRLQWLPAGGYVDIQRDPLQWLRHLVLPSLSLALVNGSLLARYVRSAFVEVLAEDWFRTARSVGWRLWPALWRHGVRNAATSLVTVVGLQLATVFVGAVVVEQVFAIPGLGTLLLDQVTKRDLVVVQDIVMLLVGVVLVIEALVELAYVALDPRLRGRREAR